MNRFVTAEEPAKVAIHRDRTIAVYRSTIHAVPVFAAIGIVAINLHGYYIGASVDGMGGFQFAAKIDEMFMVASISAVIMSFIRLELVQGKGIPFGASLAGLQFGNLSYLWSMEFWGALTAGRFAVGHKASFLLITIVCVALAATVGPSAAILLIPRLDYWPAGDTTLWLNATADQLWPILFNVTDADTRCKTQQMVPVSNGCPSSEWQSLLPWITYQQALAVAGQYPTSIQFTGKSSLRQMQFCDWRSYLNARYANCIMAFATVPHSAVADAISLGSALWSNSMDDPHQYEKYLSNRGTSQILRAWQPYTSVGCVSDWITQNSTGNLYFTNASDYAGAAGISVHVDSPWPLSQLWKEAQDSTQMRIHWLEIPDSAFANTSMGAVGVFPATSPGAPVSMVKCLIQARWVPSTLNTTTDHDGGGLVTSTTDIDPTTTTYFVLFPIYKTIRFTTAWAELLNPVIADSPQNHTVIGELLLRGNVSANSTTGSGQNGGLVLQTLLASLTTNALSRAAFNASLQGTLKTTGPYYPDSRFWLDSKHKDAFIIDPALKTSYTALQMKSTILALGYNSRTVSVKLSIAVLTCVLHRRCCPCRLYTLLSRFKYSLGFDRRTNSSCHGVQADTVAALHNCRDIADGNVPDASPYC